MRAIDKIIIHCTATPEGRAVSVMEVDRWHRERGFSGIGYHYLIGLEGQVWKGRPIDKVGAHCEGQNANSIGVCYVGGLDAKGIMPRDTRTFAQKYALNELVRKLKKEYPEAKIYGHNVFAKKDCPCFNVVDWVCGLRL